MLHRTAEEFCGAGLSSHVWSSQTNFLVFQTMEAFLGGISKKRRTDGLEHEGAAPAFWSSYL